MLNSWYGERLFLHAGLFFTASRLVIVVKLRLRCVTWLEQYESCSVCCFLWNRPRTTWDWSGCYLAKKKSIAEMLLFLSEHFSSVSLTAANKKTDHSWDFLVNHESEIQLQRLEAGHLVSQYLLSDWSHMKTAVKGPMSLLWENSILYVGIFHAIHFYFGKNWQIIFSQGFVQ